MVAEDIGREVAVGDADFVLPGRFPYRGRMQTGLSLGSSVFFCSLLKSAILYGTESCFHHLASLLVSRCVGQLVLSVRYHISV